MRWLLVLGCWCRTLLIPLLGLLVALCCLVLCGVARLRLPMLVALLLWRSVKLYPEASQRGKILFLAGILIVVLAAVHVEAHPHRLTGLELVKNGTASLSKLYLWIVRSESLARVRVVTLLRKY